MRAVAWACVVAIVAAEPGVVWAASAALSPAQATQILNSFGLRVAGCNPDSPTPMSEVKTAPPQQVYQVNLRTAAKLTVYPVKGRFVGSCKGGTAQTGRIDTFSFDGTFETGLYKDAFGDWKHTSVLRPQCQQVRTSYQVTGSAPAAAHDVSICDYTSPR